MATWKGIIISEGLREPSIINEFDVYKAQISKQDEPIDDAGNTGRWHFYWVSATDEQINSLTNQIKKGWYTHFWNKQKILAVFSGRQFEFKASDKQTWKDAIEYGRSVDITEEQLDFPTE